MPLPLFSDIEYRARTESVRAALAARGADVALVFSAANTFYLTGYMAGSDYTPQVLIVPVGADRPIFITRDMDAPTASLADHLDDDQVVSLPESYIGVADRDGFDFICDRMKSLGYANRRIALELGDGHLSGASWDKMKALLPDAAFIDITGMIARIRTVKSPAELTYMREAARIADGAMAAAIARIAPGVPQREAGAELIAALVRGTGGSGGDHAYHPNMPAGIHRVRAPHLAWSEDSYKSGDPVNIELGGSRHRYTAGLSRSVSVGKPAQDHLDLHSATLDGFAAALAVVKPGEPCGKVFDAFSGIITPRGYRKGSRLGYSIGIDWLEGTASLQHGDRTILVPNMTLHIVCGMWEQERIACIFSETVHVTDTGAQTLAETPRILFVRD